MNKKYIQYYKELINNNIDNIEIADKICAFIDFLNDNVNGLEKNNNILVEKLNKMTKRQINIVKGDYIDNGHPDNSWKEVHEMGC